jgi:hypothetical protein
VDARWGITDADLEDPPAIGAYRMFRGDKAVRRLVVSALLLLDERPAGGARWGSPNPGSWRHRVSGVGFSRFFHVTSSRNRASIAEHGFDWSRMTEARGIAGSAGPELEGCFLCLDDHEVEWFVGMDNTGGPVDVWTVDGVDPSELRESPEGHAYVPRRMPPTVLGLLRRDIPDQP